MPYNHDHIERVLRRHLAESDISVRALARKAGIAPGTIQSFLARRTSSLRIDTAYRLAEAMGMELWELLGEQPPEMRECRRIIADLRRTLRAEDARLSRYLDSNGDDSESRSDRRDHDTELPYIGSRPPGND